MSKQTLTIERINDSPSLTGPSPRELKLSPDGKLVSYLQNKADEKERYDLWVYDIELGKKRLLVDSRLLDANEELSDEEKARRERQRLFATGIVDYFWSHDSQSIVFPLAGNIYHYSLEQNGKKSIKSLTNSEHYDTDVKLSPNDHFVSFIRQQNIFLVDLNNGKEKQLTFDGKGLIKNGMAEFVAQEEMGRYTGYWWSPDEKYIAFIQVDESDIGIEKRYEINADSFEVYEQHYPRTGTANAKLRLGIVKIENGQIKWFDLGKDQDIYIPRVDWFPNSKQLAVQLQTRDQKQLELVQLNIETDEATVLITEKSDTWINLHDDLYFLETKEQFVWASERSGFKHLYLFQNDGCLIRQLTSGDWVVKEIIAVDEENGRVYFNGNKASPLEQHLYSVTINEQKPKLEKISQREGVHKIVMAENNEIYVDYFSAPEVPPQVSLHQSSGKRLVYLEENKLNESHPYWPFFQDEAKAEFGYIKAEDGQKLYYRIYKPTVLEANKRYPVIIDVYGGPGVQRIQKVWKARNTYWHKMMAANGFIIFSLDNRGGTNRGKAFEAPIYHQLGVVEVEDQVKGVEFLKSLSYVDPQRIGIYGHSYGGYMALISMMKRSDVFQVGVSGAPVTDWALYDTHYTERYLGTPQSNPEGYKASNVFPYTDGLKGALLNYHGMADDNVLFLNSTKLYKALQDKNKAFSVMDYPGSKHSLWGKKVQTHLFNTITNFFKDNL